MQKAISRDCLPQGRPMEAPNLVVLPRDNSESINPDRVNTGLKKLGHISQKVISPNMTLNPSRDLGYYRETEAILNVLRDNENALRISLHSQTANQDLLCRGANSAKDYLSFRHFDETTGLGSDKTSPSRFKDNQFSSDHLNITGTRQSQYSQDLKKTFTFGNKSGVQRRPRTGVQSNHQRNQTLLNTAYGSGEAK